MHCQLPFVLSKRATKSLDSKGCTTTYPGQQTSKLNLQRIQWAIIFSVACWHSVCLAQDATKDTSVIALTEQEITACREQSLPYVADLKKRILEKSAAKYETAEALAKLDSAMVKTQASYIETCQIQRLQEKESAQQVKRLEQLNREIAEQNKHIEQGRKDIAKLDERLASKDKLIEQGRKDIAELDDAIAKVRAVKMEAKALNLQMGEMKKKVDAYAALKKPNGRHLLALAEETKVVIENARRYISNATPVLVDEEDQEVLKGLEANMNKLESTYFEAVNVARQLIALEG